MHCRMVFAFRKKVSDAHVITCMIVTVINLAKRTKKAVRFRLHPKVFETKLEPGYYKHQLKKRTKIKDQ